MDTIHVQRDATDQRRLWLTRREGLTAPHVDATGDASPPVPVVLDCPVSSKESSGREWSVALSRVRSELGLRVGDAVAVSVSDPSIHDYPWEMLGGLERTIDVIRLIPEPGTPASHQPPPSLRVLLALPEQLSAPVRLKLDSLQREAKVSLTAADPARLAAHLARPGYFHTVHLPASTSCLSSAETVKRRLGRGRVSLLVVHGGNDAVLPVLTEGSLPCALLLGARLSPAQAAGFLQAFYTALFETIGLVGAMRAGCARLEPALRSEPILLTGHPEGQIWPLPRDISRGGRRPVPSVPWEDAPQACRGSMIGLNVGGNVNVGGDLVTGHQTKTVQRAEGDMVVTTRGGGSPPDKIVQTAGRDMVAINRSSGMRSEAVSPQDLVCPACKGEIEPDHAFCLHCGEPLHAR